MREYLKKHKQASVKIQSAETAPISWKMFELFIFFVL